MKVRHEYKAIDLNNIINVTSYGERSILDPVMIYAQIPIERRDYLKLLEKCREDKATIFDLLEQALDPDKYNYFV